MHSALPRLLPSHQNQHTHTHTHIHPSPRGRSPHVLLSVFNAHSIPSPSPPTTSCPVACTSRCTHMATRVLSCILSVSHERETAMQQQSVSADSPSKGRPLWHRIWTSCELRRTLMYHSITLTSAPTNPPSYSLIHSIHSLTHSIITHPSVHAQDIITDRAKLPLQLTYRAIGSGNGQTEFMGATNGYQVRPCA